MKSVVQWLLICFFLVVGLWLLLFGVLAAGIVLLLKAFILVLTPVTGLAGAYAASGIVCLVGAALVILVVRLVLRQAAAHKNASFSGPANVNAYESATLILKKYPLESVVVAFAAGLSSQDMGELRKVAGTLLRESESG
ncbi:MAG: hypothetical protein HPY82_26710 [Gammaproteobacteria bacterium]|nr:hypothetical protein [Gammaproteobacteria bacterium]